MSSEPVPTLTLAGSPGQRGRMHGSSCASLIRDSISFYRMALADAGITDALLERQLEELAGLVAAYDRELMAELEGIADGARASLSDILMLNARSELLKQADDGCTAVACLPETTESGHTLIAQNWDWHPSRRGGGVLLKIVSDEGPSLLTYTEAGTLGRCGLNDAGIGVVGNALQCSGSSRSGGIPIAFVRRRILSASSVQQAADIISESPRGTSVNHLVASAEGQVVAFEATVPKVYTLEATDGVLEHSNHFRSPEAQTEVIDTGIARTPDTLDRDVRIRSLVNGCRPVSPALLQEVLADHDGYPESICRHALEVTARTWVTVVSVVMDLDERRLWIAPGPVCENVYAEHRLGG